MSDEEWIKLGALIQKARNYYNDEYYEKAIEVYNNILESHLLSSDERATVLAEIGYCYHDIGDYNMAIKRLKNAEEFDNTFSNKSGFLRIWGSCLFQINRYKDAIQYQEKALKHAIKSEEKKILLLQLGRSHLFAGNGKTAIKHLKKYLKRLSNDDMENRIDGMYNLGFAHIMLNKKKSAESSFNYIIEHHRNSEDLARGYYGLTEYYYRIGNYSEAKKFGEKTLEIYPQFSEKETILYYLTMIFAQEGDKDQVNEKVNSFLLQYPDSKYTNKVKKLLK